jgi:hypothetical protein
LAKLYGFYPDGHGPVSFFVMAEDENEARATITRYTQTQEDYESYYVRDWPDSYTQVCEVGNGQVLTNHND